MNIENHLFHAPGVSSSAEIESLDTYEENLQHYIDNDFTYIPIPKSQKYYNQEKRLKRDLKEKQMVGEETHLLDVMKKLKENPFLLLDYHWPTKFYVKDGEIVGSFGYLPESDPEDIDFSEKFDIEFDEILNVWELEDRYPDLAEERLMADEERFEIITIYDLNKRRIKEMIYRVISELEIMIADRIQNKYEDSTSNVLLKAAKPRTIGRWKKSKLRGESLHIVERMNLLEMVDVLDMSPKGFVKACGFENKEELENFDSINELRNGVMHTNRRIIRSREDIDEVLDKIDRIQGIIQNAP